MKWAQAMTAVLVGVGLSLVAGRAAVAAAADAPPVRGRNLVANPGFEEGVAGWQAMGSGLEIDPAVARSGRASARCRGNSPEAAGGLRQVITLDPPVQHAFRVSGWARAEGAVVGQDFDVYLDLHYIDGTPLWGQIARFEPGTHDWQRAELVFDVAKPVRTIEVHVLFRRAQGTVWFDDIAVDLLPFELGEVRTLPGLYGGVSLGVTATASLPTSWRITVSGPAGVLASGRGEALPIRLLWAADPVAVPPAGPVTVRIEATDTRGGETAVLERTTRLTADPPGPPRGYAVWTDSSLHRVLPGALPAAVLPTPVAAVALAGGEYESVQVVLLGRPGQGLRQVQVEVSDLVTADGRQRLPASEVEWQQVGFVKLGKLFVHPAYPEAVAGWWPDPLLPVPAVTVAPDTAQAVWITVHAPPGTPAGEYAGTLTLRPADAPPATVRLAATVYGFALPVTGHLKTAFALMDGYLEQVYGKPLSTARRQAFGDFVLRHRLNPDDISRTAPPALEDLLHYRDRGLNAFNVLNMVEERGDRTWVCWSPESVYTPAFRQRLAERLDPYVAQLRQHGLAERAYIYTFDERGKEFFPIIRDFFGMVHERYPGVRTLTTAYIAQDPAVMRDLNVDWNCPLTAVYNQEQADRCRAAGLQVWAYVCLGPRFPYANWLADDPLVEARVIWWQAFHQKMDGFLYWGLNIWGREHNGKPIDPAAGPFLDWSITTGGEWDRLHGDGVLLYPGAAGPLGSIRLAAIRDGLEDYEYLWLLSQAAGRVEAGRQACLPVTDSLTHFTRDPAALYAQREAIARRLMGGH